MGPLSAEQECSVIGDTVVAIWYDKHIKVNIVLKNSFVVNTYYNVNNIYFFFK